jgi:hypothetical protein
VPLERAVTRRQLYDAAPGAIWDQGPMRGEDPPPSLITVHLPGISTRLVEVELGRDQATVRLAPAASPADWRLAGSMITALAGSGDGTARTEDGQPLGVDSLVAQMEDGARVRLLEDIELLLRLVDEDETTLLPGPWGAFAVGPLVRSRLDGLAGDALVHAFCENQRAAVQPPVRYHRGSLIADEAGNLPVTLTEWIVPYAMALPPADRYAVSFGGTLIAIIERDELCAIPGVNAVRPDDGTLLLEPVPQHLVRRVLDAARSMSKLPPPDAESAPPET